MNYIETSYLRGSSFEKLQKIPNKKISYKLFQELLSGIDSESEFLKRKPQILKAKKLNAVIDWRSIKAVVFNSFCVDANKDKEKNAIKGIIDYINEETNYQDLNDDILLKKFGINITMLVKRDQLQVQELITATHYYTSYEKKVHCFDRTFDLNGNNPEIYSAVELDLRSFISDLSKYIESVLFKIGHVECHNLEKYYTGALNCFARCSGMYNHNTIMNGNYLAKNDGNDFQHLFYLDENDTVYSKDHIFKQFERYGYIKLVSE